MVILSSWAIPMLLYIGQDVSDIRFFVLLWQMREIHCLEIPRSARIPSSSISCLERRGSHGKESSGGTIQPRLVSRSSLPVPVDFTVDKTQPAPSVCLQVANSLHLVN